MAEKMTKRELFEGLMALDEVNEHPEFVAGLMHEVELLDRKKSGSKPSKITPEIKAAVLDVLSNYPEGAKPNTVATDPTFDGMDYTPQKMTSVLRALMKDGKVVAEKVKGANFYKLA